MVTMWSHNLKIISKTLKINISVLVIIILFFALLFLILIY